MTLAGPQKPLEWGQYDRVIVFDGVCNFCNAAVDFVLKHDRKRAFKFGTLQSPQAQEFLGVLGMDREDFQTFLLLERGRVFMKSTAALRIARNLSGLWPILYLFMVVPRPLRDAVYDKIARHRYRLMGKSESCRVPKPEERDRFVL